MRLPELLSWNWSPGLLAIGLLLFTSYLWVNRFHNPRKTFLFLSGLILAELALALPLGPTPPGFQNASALSCALPGGTLFSLHMIRHIVLLMLAPPLLVSGLPEKPVRHLLSRASIQPIAHKLFNPFITWPLGVGIMWFWHIPPVFNYLTTYGTSFGHLIIPFIEIISLLGIGLLYCWPILSPLQEYRLPPLKGILYLFLACSGCSVLGILLTFSAPGMYHTVFSAGTSVAWGLTAKVDQQLGGLFMWVPGCFIYLSGVMVLLVRWFSYSKPAPASVAKQPSTAHY